MTKQILILEQDTPFAADLERALQDAGDFSVTIAATVKEASDRLTAQRYDLAFLPAAESGAANVHTLRAVQPDLRLILMTPAADFQMPPGYAGEVQAVLIKSHLGVDLSTVLREAQQHPFPPGEASVSRIRPSLDTAVIIAALHQARLGRLVQAVVFAHKTNLLAHWGEINVTQAATVALHAGKEWSTDFLTQVQFIHLAARAGDLLLYSQRVEEEFLLTLLALPETPLRELRLQAGQLATNLREVLRGKTAAEASAEVAGATAADGANAYAIVWRPIRPIPTSLHIPLRRAIDRLAAANACILTYNSVQENLVHLVVTCPPGRDSAWAAYLFKNGSEDTIQREYGVAASLWDTGYYATEATAPLSEIELSLFLERT